LARSLSTGFRLFSSFLKGIAVCSIASNTGPLCNQHEIKRSLIPSFFLLKWNVWGPICKSFERFGFTVHSQFFGLKYGEYLDVIGLRTKFFSYSNREPVNNLN